MKPELPIALGIAGIIFLNECAGSHTDLHLEESVPGNAMVKYNYQQVSSGSSSVTVTRDFTIPLEFQTGLARDCTVNVEWF